MRRERRTSAKACNRERTVGSSPQPIGEGTPAGPGGKCALKTVNIFPRKPSGVQLAKATCPPGFVTRNNSAATRWGRGANITPNMLTTRSNFPSANGNASASPSLNSIRKPSLAARARACSMRLVAISMPLTMQRLRAAMTARFPVPQATSRTCEPGRRG